MAEQLTTAVVVTVLNEAATLPALLESLTRQTRPADEIIIVDGGSRDETMSVIQKYQAQLPTLRWLEQPGSNIAGGRNAGIATTTADLIAVTDGGCTVAPDWLAELLAPIETGEADLTLAQVIPDPQNHKEACIGVCSLTQYTLIGGQWLHTHGRGLAFRRSLWQEVGHFPISFDRCEDTAFIMAAAAGWQLRAADSAHVYWRPRGTYRQVWHEYYLYARDLARAGFSRQFHLKTMIQGVGGLILILWGVIWPSIWPWVLFSIIGTAYLGRKALAGCFAVPGWQTYWRVPLVLACILTGTMAGVLVGQGQRLSQ